MDYRLDIVAIAASQHYRLMKSIVTGSDSFRLLTDEEARKADYLASVIESAGGTTIANYCREKFRKGWMSRDLRSYKLKFVFIRLRDLLKRGRVYDDLMSRIEDLTAMSEDLAGCVSDSKRRNKAALEERARTAEERKAARAEARKAEKEARLREQEKKSGQMDLFEYSSAHSPEDLDDDPDDAADCVSLKVFVPGLRKSSAPAAPRTEEGAPEHRKMTKSERRLKDLTEEIMDREYGLSEEEDCQDIQGVQDEPEEE